MDCKKKYSNPLRKENFMKTRDVRLSCGSPSDRKYANLMIPIFKYCGISYGISDLSCHRNAGPNGFDEQVMSYGEFVIACIGGHAFHKAGAIQALYQSHGRWWQQVIGVPVDKTARDSIEGLPFGVAILTAGFNPEHLESSIKNSALNIAKIVGIKRPEILLRLDAYFQIEIVAKKPRVPEVELDESGFAILPEKK